MNPAPPVRVGRAAARSLSDPTRKGDIGTPSSLRASYPALRPIPRPAGRGAPSPSHLASLVLADHCPPVSQPSGLPISTRNARSISHAPGRATTGAQDVDGDALDVHRNVGSPL